MKGGVLLATGSSGTCIFRPNIPCKGESDKVTKDKIHFKINPNTKYFKDKFYNKNKFLGQVAWKLAHKTTTEDVGTDTNTTNDIEIIQPPIIPPELSTPSSEEQLENENFPMPPNDFITNLIHNSINVVENTENTENIESIENTDSGDGAISSDENIII